MSEPVPPNPPAAAEGTIWRYSAGKWEAISPFTTIEQFAIRAIVREMIPEISRVMSGQVLELLVKRSNELRG